MYEYNLAIRFESTVRAHAGKTAITFAGGPAISYSGLNRKANKLGRYLLDRGVEQNDVVCLAGDKMFNTFAGMLACLKIGAVYAILDPESPVERLRKIMATCRPKALFAGRELGQRLSQVCTELDVGVFFANVSSSSFVSERQPSINTMSFWRLSLCPFTRLS